MTFLSIQETSWALGVSVQTLRNWDQSGYFTAERTVGGHRRYSKQDIEEFIQGRRKRVAISCWMIDHLNHISKTAAVEAEKDPRAKACGGFTKAQIGVLLRNQDTAHGETKNLPLDLFYEVAASFASPYLFDTNVMIHYSSLIFYKRMRERSNNGEYALVCESDGVVSMTFVEDCIGELSDNFKTIVKNIDKENVENVMMNAATLLTCKQHEIDEMIHKAIRSIDDKTCTKEPKVVISPPELITYHGEVERLNDNLKIDKAELPYRSFCSRLVPDNKIVISTKSDDGFNGYIFCPYMLTCKEDNRDRAMIVTGRKLLREGSKYHAVITVEP